MKIIGITGPTGAGKTTALQAVQALGGHAIDCDAVYHGLLDSSTELNDALERRFGTTHRVELAKIVFADRAALDDLNGITHAFVTEAVTQRLEAARVAGSPAVAVDAVELIGSDLFALCDASIAVLAPKADRVARIMTREGMGSAAAHLRANAQRPDDYFTRHCTYTLHNTGTQQELFDKVCELVEAIIKED